MSEILDLDTLAAVSGGAFDKNGNLIAYCKRCGKKVKLVRMERRGGSTGIFVCENAKCEERGKEKDSSQVRL